MDTAAASACTLPDALARRLTQITVVDPACGSGAFLLGMMQELVELQNTLYLRIESKPEEPARAQAPHH